ncbi:MAG: hypothetical protein ABL986_18155 [Vicinamibacterales bacterium]
MTQVFTKPIVIVALLLVAGGALAGAPVSGPYGEYPNCVAPSVPLEQHGWWQQTGDAVARHIHIAACVPNARDTTGTLVSVSGVQPFVARVTSFNNPDPITSVRWSWESAIAQEVAGTWSCPGAHGDHQQCQWFVPMNLDTNTAPDGLRELRLTENVSLNMFDQRHFGTLNFQVFVKNRTGVSENYRATPDPIARSWYGGKSQSDADFGYANVQVNYMSLFSGGVGGAQMDRTVPVISGVVPLKIKHDQTSKLAGSELWLDADFHRYPLDWTEAVVGVTRPISGARLLYRQPGLFKGTYALDTRLLANGRHALYFQTTDRDETGIHASALKVFIDVAN